MIKKVVLASLLCSSNVSSHEDLHQYSDNSFYSEVQLQKDPFNPLITNFNRKVGHCIQLDVHDANMVFCEISSEKLCLYFSQKKIMCYEEKMIYDNNPTSIEYILNKKFKYKF